MTTMQTENKFETIQYPEMELEDTCARCGKPINLAQLHGYDYELDAPVHLVCEMEENE